MNEYSQAWLDALCKQALHDDKLRSALLVIEELNQALIDGRSVNPLYRPMLFQMLAAHGAVKVQEIGWQAEINSRRSQ